MAEYDVVLVPSFTQVEDWRKQVADGRRNGMFAQTVTTFNAWIADLWELHGDGRSIVDSLQRFTIMQAAFDRIASEQAEAGDDWATELFFGADTASEMPIAGDLPDAGAADNFLTVSPGVVAMAARCVRDASGVPEFERALDAVASQESVDGLTARECAFLVGIARYRQLIEGAGLVEVGQAASYLAEHADTVFPSPVSVLAHNASPLDWRMQHFFGSVENLRLAVDEAEGASGVQQVREGVGLRFGFPSGRYAQPGLVADLVREAIAGQGALTQAEPFLIVVACKDPLGMYKQLEVELARRGVMGSVQAQVPFASTDFGKRFLALAHVVQDEAWSKDDLSDAVIPPFSGYGKSDALQIDEALRKDRLAQRDECLGWLRANSDTFSQLEEIALDPEADILIGVFEQIAFTAKGRSDAWRVEQLSAASALRSCTGAARMVGATALSCIRVLENTLVTVSYEGAGELEKAFGRVVVTSQAAAAQMGAGSCHRVVLCDMTSTDYPVADKDDAAATLFAKLGLQPFDTALARMRRMFASLQALPSTEMVCMRPLNDSDGNPTYPAAPLQELVDAYCDEDHPRDSLDETYGLPEQFLATMVQRGEELLFANSGAHDVHAAQPVDRQVPQPNAGDASDEARSLIALPRRLHDGTVIPGFSPSPSQVEAYLSCPYKWFVQSRVTVEELDEQFGALARGTYAHEVLQVFYRRFQELGWQKVNDANIDHAKQLMREIADEVEAEHRRREPGSGRYVAANQIEQREIDACKAQLVSFLDFEAQLLPGFHPAYLEYAIRPEDGIEYAGHAFIGTVDRIDVDDAGNAVIIDYKGSVNPSQEIRGKNDEAPGKVQARMYAQAVQRALGLRVVATLYVSYGKSAGCTGAYDGAVVESAHLPSMKHGNCSCALASPPGIDVVEDYSSLTFQDMLDATERLVERTIRLMEAGEVQPHPTEPNSCEYCPATMCPKRGA